MPRCPRCQRPLPEPDRAGDVSLSLDIDARPALAALREERRTAAVVSADEARGARVLEQLVCPGCGRLPD